MRFSIVRRPFPHKLIADGADAAWGHTHDVTSGAAIIRRVGENVDLSVFVATFIALGIVVVCVCTEIFHDWGPLLQSAASLLCNVWTSVNSHLSLALGAS